MKRHEKVRGADWMGPAGWALTAALLGGCYRPNLRMVAQEEKAYRLDVGPGQIVELWTGHGSIEVRGEPRADLLVNVRFSALGVTQEEADRRLGLFQVIGRTIPLGAVLHVDVAAGGEAQGLIATIEASAPRGSALRLAAAGGPARIVDIRAPVDVETSHGSIYLGRIEGAVRARTTDGAVVGEDLALTGTGAMSRFETTNGTVELEAARLEHPLQIEARGAPVDLILPAEGSYLFDLQTRKGAISIRGAGQTVAESASGRRLTHAIGGGQIPVTINTSAGDVVVRLRAARSEAPRGDAAAAPSAEAGR